MVSPGGGFTFWRDSGEAPGPPGWKLDLGHFRPTVLLPSQLQIPRLGMGRTWALSLRPLTLGGQNEGQTRTAKLSQALPAAAEATSSRAGQQKGTGQWLKQVTGFKTAAALIRAPSSVHLGEVQPGSYSCGCTWRELTGRPPGSVLE